MNLNKTIITYVFLTAGTFLFDKLYALFGHGVSSPWMSNLYLYLLGLGVLVFMLFKIFMPDIASRKGYRMFYNTYNSGVAILANGMLLYGILEIAGATSKIVPWFLYAGCGFIATAAVIFCTIAVNKVKCCLKGEI